MKDDESKTEQAERIVKNHMLGAALTGLVPVPLADLAILSGVQLKMLHRLSRLYGIDFSKHLGKSVIAALLGGGFPSSLSANLIHAVRFSSLTKGMPLFGAAAGAISIALLGGGSTYAIGKVFIQHFEMGGTLLDFDPDRVRDYYAAQLEQGKAQVTRNFAGIRP